MRKERVDASDDLSGLLDVGLVGNFAAVFRDGEDARAGEGFEGIAEMRVDVAQTDGKSIAQVKQKRGQNRGNEDALDDG